MDFVMIAGLQPTTLAVLKPYLSKLRTMRNADQIASSTGSTPSVVLAMETFNRPITSLSSSKV
eukprot:scaffold4199_cov101-Cylindrotheca_fusiformis.AAC.8